MRYSLAVLLGALLLAFLSAADRTTADDKAAAAKKPAAATEADAKKPSAPPKIQMAILLDTSNSMDGLINQARTQLWKIVNEFAKATRDGKQPELQVALFEYGKSSVPAKDGYVRMIVPLTDDLDKISDELFALKTQGGSEYCGMVIHAATKQLKWSESDADFKCIFIAGNEAFDQGPVNPEEASSAAIAHGITVNTIFCGPFQVGVNTLWQKGAQLADGSYTNIDQNQQVAVIKTPHDEKLAKLSSQLNGTYVFFGKAEARKSREALQKKQDASAKAATPAAAADRAKFKASRLYRNSDFDLVDAIESDKVKLKDLKEADLPAALKGKNEKEQKAYLDGRSKERKKIQAEIKKLSAQREKYIATERAKRAEGGKETFDAAIIKAIRAQATKRNFKFKDE